MSKKSAIKKTGIMVVLAFVMTLLVPFAALAAEDVNLTLDGQGKDNRITCAAGADVTIATDVWCNIWVKENGVYSWKGVTGPGQNYVLENVQPGCYVVDAYAVDGSAYARSVFFVDSKVNVTAEYADGVVTVTAEATNIANPYFQFWKADKELKDWASFGNAREDGSEGYYGTAATQSFTAEAGKTYEIAVYAKDENGRSQWQDAVAATIEFSTALETVPDVKSFQAVSSLEIGKKMVIVELDTDTPENYNVSVAGVQLQYNDTAKKFVGDVPEADAVEENVVVTAK